MKKIGSIVNTEFGVGEIVGIDEEGSRAERWIVQITDPIKKHHLISDGRPLSFWDDEIREAAI